MISINFIYPYYLAFLLLIPVFIFIHLISLKATKGIALKFANFEAISKIKGVDFFSKNIVILFLSLLVLFLLVLSLAGLNVNTLMDASTHSFVIALDNSHSMEANDMSPDRMSAAKAAAIKFVDELPYNTRVGVMSFSGSSFIGQDISSDRTLIKSAIRNVEVSDVAGTDLYEAVITGANLLKGEDARAIILLSDGQINVGDIDEAIKYLNTNKIMVHTIAVGTKEGGETSYGLSKVDEDSLKALSYNTRGQFFSASNDEELAQSFKSSIEKTQKRVDINLSSYLLMAAIILFSIEYYLVNGKYRRLI